VAETNVADLIHRDSIRLGVTATDRDHAIRICGEALVAAGAATPDYIDTMLAREQSVSTYIGEGVAIPHGTLDGKDHVRRDALSFVTFPDGVDWNGERVTVGIGIAARDNGHIAILAELADILLDPDRAAALRAASSSDDVLALLTPSPDDSPDDGPDEENQ
jgi:PTS system mannitol-specific IIA component